MLFLLTLLWSQTASATVIDLDQIGQDALGNYAAFLKESDTVLSQNQALTLYLQGQFHTADSQVLTFGIDSKPVWVALSVNNLSPQAQKRQFVLDNSWLDKVDLTLINRETGQQIKQSFGDLMPFSARPWLSRTFQMPVTLQPGITDILVRVETPDAMVIPIHLLTAAQSENMAWLSQTSYGLVYGYLMALMLYNAMLFFGLRDKIYLAYTAMLATFMLGNLAYTGHAFMLLWPNATMLQQWIQPLVMLLFGCAGLSFGLLFLGIKQLSARLFRAILALMFSVIGTYIATILTEQRNIAMLLSFSFITSYIIIMLMMGVYALRQKMRHATYFLIAVSAGSLGVSLTAIISWGMLPFNSWLFRAAELGMLIEATLLALALSDRFRMVQSRNVEVEKLADTDLLTELNNRRGFIRLTERCWSISHRHQRPVSIIIFDLDGFKKLNDIHGHVCGDLMLKHVGALINKRIRKEDVAARWGGEEFVLFLPDTSMSQALLLAERLKQDIAETGIEYQQKHITITASFGVAEKEISDDSLERLIAQADKALYQSKATGKNRVSLFTGDDMETAVTQPFPSN